MDMVTKEKIKAFFLTDRYGLIDVFLAPVVLVATGTGAFYISAVVVLLWIALKLAFIYVDNRYAKFLIRPDFNYLDIVIECCLAMSILTLGLTISLLVTLPAAFAIWWIAEKNK
jgi:hypothetical protein